MNAKFTLLLKFLFFCITSTVPMLPVLAIDEVKQQVQHSVSTNVVLSNRINRIVEKNEPNRFKKAERVSINDELRGKTVEIKKKLKKLQKSNDKAPSTLEEAYKFLLQNLSMACLPAKYFEEGDFFYFSGGTSSKREENFSSGFAIKKGESIIYVWSKEIKKSEKDDKSKK